MNQTQKYPSDEAGRAGEANSPYAVLFKPLTTSIATALVWTLLVGTSLFFNIEREKGELLLDAEDAAITNLNKDISFRKWATGHGGVYVPVTETQKPVPFLEHVPGRDVTTSDGRQLTLLNPASIIRQVMDAYSQEYGIKGRITGLKYLNPANVPDAWEKAQLEAFERGEKKEATMRSEIDGAPFMRHLRAMYMTKGCDKCHAILGYKDGDFRGAIGVNVPLAALDARLEKDKRELTISHGLVWLAGLLGIIWFGWMTAVYERSRTRREEELRQSAERIRSMSDAAGAYLWEIDTNMIYTHVSGQSLTVKGYAPEELIGHTPMEFMPKEDVAPVGEIVNRAIAEKSTFRLQHRDITRNGRVWWEEVYGAVFCDDDGKVIGLRGTGMSINARKALEQERELYHRFFDASSDMMGIADPNGAFKKVNPAFLEKLGYAEYEMLSRPFIEFVHIDDRQLTLDEMAQQLQGGGQSIDFTNRYRHKNGSYRWLTWRASYDRDEGVTYAVATDITERKQAEEKLAETLNFNEKLSSSSPVGIITYLVDSGECAYANEAAAKAVNAKVEQLLAQNFRKIASWQASGLFNLAEQAITSGNQQRSEIEITSTFGSHLWLSVMLSTFIANGKKHLLLMFDDISGRKRHEQLLAARLRLTQYADEHTLDELLVAIIDEAEAITDSRIGFYHFVESDQKHLTLHAWSSSTGEKFCKVAGKGMHYSLDEAGVWVDCVRERKTVIHNDYAALPHRKGMPEGHAEVVREMVTPTLRNDAIVSIMGVGNKQKDYTEADAEILSLLANWAWEIVERKRAEESLRHSDERIRSMSAAAGAYLWEIDANMVYTFISGQSMFVKGHPPESLLGHTPMEFMPEEDIIPMGEVVNRAIADKSSFVLQHRNITPTGEVWWEEVHGSVYLDGSGNVAGLRGTGMGINARKASEARIKRLANLYAALSECNQAIVRSTSQDGLFESICRNVITFGGMKMAWIGLLDEATGQLDIAAKFGDGLEYLDGSRIPENADDEPDPPAKAIRKAASVWDQDILNQAYLAAWREKAVECGFYSAAALPLHRYGRVVGVFSLFGGEVGTFDEDMRALLEEMASDISYALDGFERAADLKLAAEVFEQGKEGIMITDTKGRILRVNRAFTDISGYGEAEALGQSAGLLSSGRQSAEFYREMWAAINATGHWQGEIWNRRKDGAIYPEWLAISRVLGEDGQPSHYVGIFSDITQHKRAEERIQRLAHFDALTGLPNRALLNDRTRHAISMVQRTHEQLAVLFLDLDHFKNINDTLGHSLGDELLVEVAQRIKAVVREEDTVSRQGGDEFVMVLPGTDAAGAAHVAEKLIAAVSVIFKIEQYELIVTPSIGIAMYPSDGEDFDTLSKCADTAMYRTKQEGRNAFRFFTPEMQEHSTRNLQLEGALRHALDRGQLQLHYQPQVSLKDGSIIGAEALLRWRHPELGAVSPAEFIPVAEDSGLILPIGEWVLRTAVRQMRAWMDSGIAPMIIAVNLSAVQFRHAHLPTLVSSILEEEGLTPQYLELELTEGVAMDDPLAAIAVMDELHARGVRMSIDDFGTGYSSLSYLKRFSVYKLKIDQSFVRDITVDPEDKAIVGAVISLAGSLGLRTIAEGVETEGQLAFLREQGCQEVQGYFYSKPLPAAEFEAFVRGWK